MITLSAEVVWSVAGGFLAGLLIGLIIGIYSTKAYWARFHRALGRY